MPQNARGCRDPESSGSCSCAPFWSLWRPSVSAFPGGGRGLLGGSWGSYKLGLGFRIWVQGLGFWGSWVVISGVISKVSIVITHIRGLLTILISTHEPPSSSVGLMLRLLVGV